MPQEEKLSEIIETIQELCDDATAPKNIKLKFHGIISSLNSSQELSVKVNKALHDLDEISDDTNLQTYIRTQIWNIASMLEKL
ncbi:MAG: UPF0147 family protein [Nanoarchaeota archaeon]|nr:UPF0147 family protein [Nanoarchaeota archaeon]